MLYIFFFFSYYFKSLLLCFLQDYRKLIIPTDMLVTVANLFDVSLHYNAFHLPNIEKSYYNFLQWNDLTCRGIIRTQLLKWMSSVWSLTSSMQYLCYLATVLLCSLCVNECSLQNIRNIKKMNHCFHLRFVVSIIYISLAHSASTSP